MSAITRIGDRNHRKGRADTSKPEPVDTRAHKVECRQTSRVEKSIFSARALKVLPLIIAMAGRAGSGMKAFFVLAMAYCVAIERAG